MEKSIRHYRLWPSTSFLAALLLASAFLPLPHDNAIAGMPSICVFHNFTGYPCPGCGLTRAWVSMAHGHFREALVWHPLGPFLFVSALIYTLWSAWLAVSKPPFPQPVRAQRAMLLGLTTLLFTFWVARLAGVFPLPGG